MKNRAPRGSALIASITVLMAIFIVGSAILSMSMQAMRRGRYDSMRTLALALAEAGAEKAVYYLRTVAPDGTTTGKWRTAGLNETVSGQGDYTLVVQDGTGANAGKTVITSIGHTGGSSTGESRRAVRVVLKLDREDISIWNNAIFGGVGQSGKSINGNVVIRGSVHLLGDGEEFTDLDNDHHWDAGEPFTDTNHNGVYDLGEPYTDQDGDGHRDGREPFDDVNGNGTRDPALTVTDLSSEFGGSSNIGNNYTGMPSSLRNLIPNPPTIAFQGETVDTLNAKLRVKHGRVDINGAATVGDPQAPGGSPMVKETMDGSFVSDGFGGNQGANQVYADNGTSAGYDLKDVVHFPTLTAPTVKNGTSYSSYMGYLQAAGLNITGPITLKPGVAYGPVSDGRGNLLAVDTSGNITIRGIVYVTGDIRLDRNGGNKTMTYSGRGSLVSTGNVYISSSITPATPTFPTVHGLGVIARHRIELATQGGDSQLSLAGAFYAQEQIISAKQNELAGTFVTSYFSMSNVPHMYQVPSLPDNLPPGMPGSDHIWIKTIRTDSWREVSPS
jgi:hypothetical protein